MDESFLSDADVVAASKDFVCIRLATYEDKTEAEFLTSVYVGRSGELENTVFGILSPDADETLCRSGRSPNFAFRSPTEMAKAMKKIAREHPGKKGSAPSTLPTLKNVRLSLNVASCDGLPMVLVYGRNKKHLAELESQIIGPAFSDSVSGRFCFAKTTDGSEGKEIKGFDQSAHGFYLIEPDDYGLHGKVKSYWSAESDSKTLRIDLSKAAGSLKKSQKQHHAHVRGGHRKGIEWDSEIPITDPHAIRAQQRRKEHRGR